MCLTVCGRKKVEKKEGGRKGRKEERYKDGREEGIRGSLSILAIVVEYGIHRVSCLSLAPEVNVPFIWPFLIVNFLAHISILFVSFKPFSNINYEEIVRSKISIRWKIWIELVCEFH